MLQKNYRLCKHITGCKLLLVHGVIFTIYKLLGGKIENLTNW